jgi:hypothetical protein
MELLEISCVLGLEFKTAVMQVDFEEIEFTKQTIAESRYRKKKKASKTA